MKYGDNASNVQEVSRRQDTETGCWDIHITKIVSLFKDLFKDE